MLIEKVELKNIKPYKEQTFQFAPGINVLSGPNGAGKSTVFEAIGYALFGVDAQAFIGKADRFVRKGAKRGQVRVHFKADDGQRYLIERRVGTQSVWRLATERDDGTEEVIEVKNNQELEDLLKKVLFSTSDAASGKLADHFLNIIGPLQNDFLGPFVKKGQPRINDFDRILGISAWREAFTRSLQLEREAQNIIEQRESIIEEKRTQVATYDQVVAELKERQQQLAEKRETLAAVSTELERTTEQLAQFEKIKADRDHLEKGRDQQQQQQSNLEVAKQATEKNLVSAQAAKKVCQQHADAHAAYLRAETQLRQLRQEQKQAEAVQKSVTDLEKEIEKLSGQLGSEEQGLDEQARRLRENQAEAERQLTQVEKQMQEVKAEGQRAKADQDAYKNFADRLAELDSVSALRDTALKWINDLTSLKKEIGEYQRALEQKEALQREASEEKTIQEQVDKLTTEWAALDARKKQFQEGDEKLSSGECPFFAEPCLNLQQKAQPPADFFGRRIAELESQEQGITTRVGVLKQRLEHVRTAQTSLAKLDQVEKQLQKAERRASEVTEQLDEMLRPLTTGTWVERLGEWIETAPSEPQRMELRQVLERAGPFEFQRPEGLEVSKPALEAVAEQCGNLMMALKQALESRLTELDQKVNGLRAQFAAAEAEAKKIREAQEKYQNEEQQIATKRVALDKQKKALADKREARQALLEQGQRFEDLPKRIEEHERILADTRTGYSTYEQNKKQAEQVEPLEREIKEIREQLTASTQTLARLQAELESLRSQYDEKAHQEAKRQQTEFTAQRASLAAELKSLGADVTRLEKEKARMDTIQQEIRAGEAEIKQYKKTHRFIQDLRARVFNKVSEQLSERFREEVSHIADRIYRVIAASDEELRWGTSYNIELVDFQQGKERVRSDEELSGGEMMNAVVALRLALLQTTGSKIGFFDEPTSNLDQSRRANLAQAFRSLDVGQGEIGEAWYDQLFLISHDVTFTEITDQIIHLTKGAADQRGSRGL